MLFFSAFLSGVLLFYLFDYFPFSSTALFVSASAYLFIKKKYLLVPVIIIGVVYGYVRLSPEPVTPEIWNKELRVTGRFIQKINPSATGNDIQVFQVDTAVDEKTGEEIEFLHDEDIGVVSDIQADHDERYELLLQTGRDNTRLNPGGFPGSRLYGKVTASDNKEEVAYPVVHIFNRIRNDLNTYTHSRFKPDSAALVSAITTGEMSGLSDGLRNAFNVSGLAHILSISGTHFGLFSVMLFGIFIFVIRRLPYRMFQRLTIYLSPSQAAAILCIPFMLMYLGISGSSVPAVRSFIMISLFLFGLLIGRKGFWLNSLLFAAFLIVLWDPEVVLSLSFQLSFITVLFIGFSIEKKEDAEVSKSKPLRYIKNSFMLTIAATIGSAPLVAYQFHYFSVISPLSNLIVTPLICFVLVPLSLVSSFTFILTDNYLFTPLVSVSADMSVALVELVAKIPFADIKIPAFPPVLIIFFYAGSLIYFALGRPKKMLIVPLIPFIVYAMINLIDKKELNVTFLDVGQGDSAVVELPDRKTIVIDTGRTGREAAAFLKYLGKKEIDALVLSHVHPDHTGGLEYLLTMFHIKEMWDNGRTEYPEGLMIPENHRALERGDVLAAGTHKIEALHPYREFYSMYGSEYDEENNSSLVLKITGRKLSFLFTGDMEEEAEENLLHIGKWLDSDVIKIPHHGSRTSLSDDLLLNVSPSIAVISVGRDNQFSHPSPLTLEKLEGRKIFRTDIDGAVKITETARGYETKTFKDFAFEKAGSFEKEVKNIKKLFSVW
ncbi:MAG: DNA internalization-related competence protein ComEC/Rec2 [Nitrospirae bacterium GWC2_42_7]|nr:MAG: DNA internalization-related competence protein ComEC/Rec2 [Nitrospirae bacterium GWC2_42_7]